ncbi:MAG: hypothetical protein ACPGRH_02650 [Alphaproteobacteria bacterium]
MSSQTIDIAQPFFDVTFVSAVESYDVVGRAIVINVGDDSIFIEGQTLTPLQSIIVVNAQLIRVDKVLLVFGFDKYKDEADLMASIRQVWPSAFELRGEERLRGVEHYMSPKVWLGQMGLTFYHSASIPLNVGLHKEHPFCAIPGFREVHTQIVGLGKMQQCAEQDLSTLYLEEIMAPGVTHRPMYDADGNYPWHQFETITPSIFMALEFLPNGANPPS